MNQRDRELNHRHHASGRGSLSSSAIAEMSADEILAVIRELERENEELRRSKAELYDQFEAKVAQRSEEHRIQHRAFEVSSNGILLVDARHSDHPIIFANAAFEKMTGYTVQEVIGRNCRFLASDGRSQTSLCELREAIDQGQSRTVVVRNYRKDGTSFFNRVSVSPIHDQQGNVTHYVNIQDDVTEQIRVQEELEREKALIEGIVNGVPDALMLADVNRRLTFCNSSVKQVFGYDPDELIGKSTTVLYADIGDHQQQGNIRFRPDAEEQLEPFEVMWRRRDGSTFLGETIGTILLDHDGQPLGFLGLVRDISERKRIAETLRREHDFNENLIETAQSIVLVLDTDGRILRFNPYFESLTGWKLSELQGCDWFETCLPQEDRQAIRSQFHRALAGERSRGSVNAILAKDGSIREIEWYDAALVDASDKELGLLCTGQDITKRKAMERHLLQIAADEQRRIGIDLHDSVGQELTGLALMADSLTMALQQKSLSESELSKRIGELIGQSLEQVRNLARGLNPVDIDARGLDSALTELACHVTDLYRIQCSFEDCGRIELADSETATNLYRIAQEAITNAVKHGKADKIVIELSQSEKSIALRIADNGIGVSNADAMREGIGMQSMGYRASIIAGELSVVPGEEGGTIVVCLLPRETTSRPPAN